jgi:D-tyrosyl-tRNA(Tyr) deacylase
VEVGGAVVGEIEAGLLLLTGFGHGDISPKIKPAAEKIVNMRLFNDHAGKFNLSVRDSGGSILIVPQFTLYADTSKGRRPEFFGALAPNKARILFQEFLDAFKPHGLKKVAAGEFGADMKVELLNDGPVTLMLEF